MAAKHLFFLYLFFSSFSITNSQTTQYNTEQQILLQIKKAFGDPWALQSWNTSIPHCNWTGIKCNGDSVTRISLFNLNLTEPMTSTICNLKNLTYLDLSYNYLPGPFPTFLYNCTNLQYLDISQNLFVGMIPSTINQLPNQLNYLSLSANNFTGDIPSSIGQLSALQYLLLDNNLFDGTFPAELGNLSNVENLWLANNSFTPAQIPSEFGNMTSLVFLWMSSTNLFGEIPESFEKLSDLMRLDLAMNSLSGRIPHGIWTLEKLEFLYLFHNELSGDINNITGAKHLVYIDISMNKLNGSLPVGLGELHNLFFLYLYWNQLSGEIPAAIGLLQSLTDLRLFNNNLTGSLPQEWGNYSNLNNIELSNNRISGEIPSTISTMRFLNSLDLRNNQLNGKIPEAIGSLSHLSRLALQNNQLSGPIPAEMGNLQLSFLNLSYNQLSGEIPSFLQDDKYALSFLSNPNLCSHSNSLVDVAHCDQSRKLSTGLLISLLILGALFFFALGFYRDMLARNVAAEEETQWDLDSKWKQTTFHSVDFSGLNIIEKLDDNNLIGSGGGGIVYRITLNEESGEMAAVKKIWNSRKLDERLEKEFLTEVQILGLIRHANIVKLLGCMSGSNTKLLIYEYMENGSLDRWLHHQLSPADSRHNQILDWPTRLGITIGAAKGLSYLHHYCSPPIVHRDVKSGNILLDSEFKAKIADFGLARMLIKAGEPESVSAIAGSFGYMAPAECGWLRKVNEKMDVYSFGVVLLELITGRKANDGGDEGNLAEWVWHHFQETGRVGDVVADEIKEPSYVQEMEAVLKLGIICTGTLPSSRPSMKQVVQVLLQIARVEIGDNRQAEM